MTNDPVEDDVRAVRGYFDTLGAGEWERLVQAPSARVALELHRRFPRPVHPAWLADLGDRCGARPGVTEEIKTFGIEAMDTLLHRTPVGRRAACGAVVNRMGSVA
jgi:hypothetical protein